MLFTYWRGPLSKVAFKPLSLSEVYAEERNMPTIPNQVLYDIEAAIAQAVPVGHLQPAILNLPWFEVPS